MASESIVSCVIIQKHVNGMPLYRLDQGLKQEGAEISLATMANWVIAVAKNYLSIMYDFFHRELVKRKYLMADETRVQVLKEPGRKAETQSFMWLYRSGEAGLNPIILYNYQETRGGKNASNFLKGFKGYLETDGYTGYNRVEGITRCCCWAHARRKFVDAIPKGKEFDYRLPAVQGVRFIDRLFKLKEEIRKQSDFTYEKRYEFRLQKEKPILGAFWRWVNEQRPVRKSKFDTAVMYVKNHNWPNGIRTSEKNLANEKTILQLSNGWRILFLSRRVIIFCAYF